MRRAMGWILALGALTMGAPAHADLAAGQKAPLFATKGAMAGKAFRFDLKRALAQGPVVLYFYPKAFTQGCTLEAHAFAEAMPRFKAAGASVIGLSADDLPMLKRFSTQECRSAFPVATATPAIIAAYDVKLDWEGKRTAMAKRVSYVLDRTGRIVLVHSDMDWRDHVSQALAAVQRLKAGG